MIDPVEYASASLGTTLRDFDGESYGAEYLELCAGDEVALVRSCQDTGWALGIRIDDGAEGWFPYAFWSANTSGLLAGEMHRAMEPPVASGSWIASIRRDDTSELPTSQRIDNTFVLPIAPSGRGDLQSDRGLAGSASADMSSEAELVSDRDSGISDLRSDSSTRSCNEQSKGPMGRALKDFDADGYGPGCLQLTQGEQVCLLNRCQEGSGWALGSRLLDGTEGWFPLSYWVPLDEKSHAVARDTRMATAAAVTNADLPAASGFEHVDTAILCESDASVYSRELLLGVQVALSGEASAQQNQIGIRMLHWPRDVTPNLREELARKRGRSAQKHDDSNADEKDAEAEEPQPEFAETLKKLLDVAGGKATKVRNLVAAGLALNVMSGNHNGLWKEVLSTVESRPEQFVLIPIAAPCELANRKVALSARSGPLVEPPGDDALDAKKNSPRPNLTVAMSRSGWQ